jgi:hypothetical protein
LDHLYLIRVPKSLWQVVVGPERNKVAAVEAAAEAVVAEAVAVEDHLLDHQLQYQPQHQQHLCRMGTEVL